jgi:hypothetical protein
MSTKNTNVTAQQRQNQPSNVSNLKQKVPGNNNNGQGVTSGPGTGSRIKNTSSTTRGASRGISRVSARGRGGFAGGPGLFEVSPQGEVLHEGIPQSKEFTHLSELKEVASEHARKETAGTTSGIPKGGAASLAQSALGKYATAVSEETGIPSLSVQGMVPLARKVDKEKLVQELKEEAQERVIYEVTHMGRVPQAGPARKVEEAAKRLEHVLKMDRDEEQFQTPTSTGVQAAYTTPPVSPSRNENQATTVSGSGELLHEGVDQETEFQHLSELKEVISEHARSDTRQGRIPHGSTTSTIQSAMSEYATAISEEINVPAPVVQSMVPIAEYHVDEAKLTQELKEEAQKRNEYERQKLGFVPLGGPATKVEEAAEKLERVLKIDEGPEVPPNQGRGTKVPDQQEQATPK